MLVTLKEVLSVAQEKRFAVGAFNTSNLETTQAIIRAAVAMKSPVIVQTSEKAIAYAGLKEIAALVTIMAKEASVPVVLHVDHGRNLDTIFAAIDEGYSSVMVDGSHLSLEENIAQTKKVVAYAHRRGVSVEAEIGRVGGVEDYISADESLTDPTEAREFAKATRCDALAVGIGNNHGKPRPDEKLHLDRLAQIRKIVDTPLVLHGASGTAESLIKQAIKIGVTKINIDTDVRIAFSEAERELLAKDKKVYDPREILAPATEAMEDVVKKKMALFGSAMTAKYYS